MCLRDQKVEGNQMSIEYTEKDPSLPLVLPQIVFQREVYAPSSFLCTYTSELFDAGYSEDTLPQELVDIRALAFYVGQVHNGGHSQFIHNCFERREKRMEQAARAARMIGLPEMADLVDRCAAFCRNNPELADEQDGVDHRAEELEDLDDELYALNYTHEERWDFLNTLPPGHCDDLRDKYRIEDLEETAMTVVAKVEQLLPERTDDYAAKCAAELARPFFEKIISKTEGPKPSEEKNDETDSKVRDLAWRIERVLKGTAACNRTRDLSEGMREILLEIGLWDLSRYSLRVAAWIARHPNLELVPLDQWSDRIEEIVASSPFTGLELQRRELERVTRELPDDARVAKSAIVAMLAIQDGKEPLYDYDVFNAYLWPRYEETYLIKISGREFYFCTGPDNRLVVHLTRKSRSFPLAKMAVLALRQLGLIHKSELWSWPRPCEGWPSSCHLSQKRSALMLRILQWLTSIPIEVAGKRFTHKGFVPGLAAKMCDLHVPEAYMQWSDSDKRMYGFRWGILESLDTEARTIAWRFPLEDEIHQMIACPEFVEFSVVGQSRKARYPARELSELRRKLARPSR